ncbi:LytR/AlgR family response regulator transcription factor [Dyella choica]|nr:LytTR family DNA-binding domain-containing protein [Dyella choica]
MKQRYFDLLAVVGVFVAYSVTMRLAMHLSPVDSLIGGAANAIPVAIFGAVVRRVIQKHFVGKPAATQLLAHLPLCATFAVLSYGLLIVLLGLFNGAALAGFLVKPLSMSAAAWQTLENVTTYALISAMSYLQAQYHLSSTAAPAPVPIGPVIQAHRSLPSAGHRQEPGRAALLSQRSQEEPAKEPEAARGDSERSRYFVRIGDELRPIDMDTVVSIGGADDYAEVWTLSGKHLVRMTLTDFTKSLDPARYARVHRSWIVNIHRIARAEPAGGGRLLLHMETGQTISTSRAGARLLRDRVI